MNGEPEWSAEYTSRRIEELFALMRETRTRLRVVEAHLGIDIFAKPVRLVPEDDPVPAGATPVWLSDDSLDDLVDGDWEWNSENGHYENKPLSESIRLEALKDLQFRFLSGPPGPKPSK
jgi:hypothetical protein